MHFGKSLESQKRQKLETHFFGVSESPISLDVMYYILMSPCYKYVCIVAYFGEIFILLGNLINNPNKSGSLHSKTRYWVKGGGTFLY